VHPEALLANDPLPHMLIGNGASEQLGLIQGLFDIEKEKLWHLKPHF
jgi:hypothetical protein